MKICILLIFTLCLGALTTACQGVQQATKTVEQLTQPQSPVTNPTKDELAAASSPCDDAADNGEAENCARKEFEKSDAELNQSYNKILSDLKRFQENARNQDAGLAEKYKRDEENLRITQDSWVIYRKNNCKAEREAALETATAAFIELGCFQRLTEDRIEILNAIYQNK